MPASSIEARSEPSLPSRTDLIPESPSIRGGGAARQKGSPRRILPRSTFHCAEGQPPHEVFLKEEREDDAR